MIAAAAPPKIRFDGVGKTFEIKSGPVNAVDDITLDIAPGTFFVIVGPSGCGKTTLLRMTAGLETPTRGTITIGRASSDRPANSMIFQGDSIFPWMTVYDNAAYGLRMRGVAEKEITDVVGHFLSRTGLTRFAKAYPHQLSGGMKQRVSIARAFANDPEVLLMDEPFSALDEQNKTLLQEELLRIWEETKKTVLFITHSVDEAVFLSTRICVMSANPGRTRTILPNDLPQPRADYRARTTAAFQENKERILDLIRDEVRPNRIRSPLP